jgi:hypothetical protein
LTRDISPENADFDVLADFLRDELKKLSTDERAIRLKSRYSFTSWAETVVGHLAEQLGLTLGLVAGWILDTYETVKNSFSRGWQEGLDRGRGRSG